MTVTDVCVHFCNFCLCIVEKNPESDSKLLQTDVTTENTFAVNPV